MELLPAPLGADDGANLVFPHVERNVGQGLYATERKADVPDVENDVADGLWVGAYNLTGGRVARRDTCRCWSGARATSRSRGVHGGFDGAGSAHAAAFTGAKVLASAIFNVALTLPVLSRKA